MLKTKPLKGHSTMPIHLLKTENEYREFFRITREKEGIVCKKCGGLQHRFNVKKACWYCVNCPGRITLTSGTLLQHTKIPLRYWFLAMLTLLDNENGVSAKAIQTMLGHKRYQPIWAMIHKIKAEIYRGLDVERWLKEEYLPADKKLDLELAILQKGCVLLIEKREVENAETIDFQMMNMSKKVEKHAPYTFSKTMMPRNIRFKRNSYFTKIKGTSNYLVDFWASIKSVHKKIKSKYLQNYLDWYVFVNNLKHLRAELLQLLIYRCVNIAN